MTAPGRNLHDAEDVARVVPEVRVVDDRRGAGRLRERGLDRGCPCHRWGSWRKTHSIFPAAPATLDGIGRLGAVARRGGERGGERDPALGREEPEDLGGPVSRGVVHDDDLDALEVGARREDLEPREGGRDEVLLVNTGTSTEREATAVF
jgi:hypothetical protein